MPSQPDDLIGRVVAERYRVLDRLGAGGMGTVYLAVHQAIEKKVALKVLRPEYSAKPDLVARFQREAISASRIKHPNVLDVFDFGQLDNGCFYLAMEFLEGHDLADELEKARWLSPDRALKIALQVCKALAAAHAKGVVHRDLKPENVFLQVTGDGDEVVKIVDFGIAQLRSTEEVAKAEPQRRRLTRTGMIFGTPEYMSPEQGAGKHADLRVDVYAAGVILYEMLTGAVPFTGDTFFGVLNAHMNDPLLPLRASNPDVSVSPELEAVIAKALAKDPDQRLQSMRELATALTGTPEGIALDPSARKSAIPSVTLAEFDRVAAASARQERPAAVIRARATAPVSGAVTLDSVPSDLGTADTQPVAEPAKGTTGSRAWVLVVLGVAAISAAALAALKLMPKPGGPNGAESATRENPVELATGVVPVASSAPALAPSTNVAVAEGVRISVITEPEGAVLLKNGFQICDTTPCEFVAKPNEGLELEARKDKLRGTAKVLAQKEQTVNIKLGKGNGTAVPAPSAEMVPCLIMVEQDGLKVPKQAMCPKPK